MEISSFDVMLDHVRALYQALTGSDLPEPAGQAQPPPSAIELTLRFRQLDEIARQIPAVATRVPPFGFTPAIDVLEGEREVQVLVDLPGVRREDVQAQVVDGTLVIWGNRPGGGRGGRVLRHGELPRGPFRRLLLLPPDVAGQPARVELVEGTLRIALTKLPTANVAKA